MTERDKALIRQAKHQRWEDMNPDAADSEEAKQILYDIMVREHHNAEYYAGML